LNPDLTHALLYTQLVYIYLLYTLQFWKLAVSETDVCFKLLTHAWNRIR